MTVPRSEVPGRGTRTSREVVASNEPGVETSASFWMVQPLVPWSTDTYSFNAPVTGSVTREERSMLSTPSSAAVISRTGVNDPSPVRSCIVSA